MEMTGVLDRLHFVVAIWMFVYSACASNDLGSSHRKYHQQHKPLPYQNTQQVEQFLAVTKNRTFDRYHQYDTKTIISDT